ncbi:unnamed protein product [Gemmata massiliana]|uniref:Uncharacterized protein n=1 Tax=Gemmata massiliana TaxID=1210884 RepID=A0A6P2DBR9_9BACT|nr:unnamed protein product [Gemmata massiliana]
MLLRIECFRSAIVSNSRLWVAPAEQRPEPLDHVELRTVTGQALEFQVRARAQRRLNAFAGVPRGVVDDQHHARVLLGRVANGDLAQALGEGPLQPATVLVWSWEVTTLTEAKTWSMSLQSQVPTIGRCP